MSVVKRNKYYDGEFNWVVSPKGFSFASCPLEKMMEFLKHCIIREWDGWDIEGDDVSIQTLGWTYRNWCTDQGKEQLTVEQFVRLCDMFLDKNNDNKDHKVYKNLMLFPNIEEKKKWWEKNSKTEN